MDQIHVYTLQRGQLQPAQLPTGGGQRYHLCLDQYGSWMYVINTFELIKS